MYKVRESVRSTHGPDGATVLDLRDGRMFNMNLIGSRILEMLENGASQSEIVDEIRCRFSVSEDTANHDFDEFMRSLEELHLIEEVSQEEQWGLKSNLIGKDTF